MADLKSQIKALMNQRQALEEQISESSLRLEAAGVNNSAPLVDKEVITLYASVRPALYLECRC